MMKVAGLKEIRLAEASPGHLLIFRHQGEKIAIPVRGPQMELGVIVLTSGTAPVVRWMHPQTHDTVCVDLGSFELVIDLTLQAFSSGPQHFRAGALIIESDGPSLICLDPNGMEVRFGTSDWRLNPAPIHGANFYIAAWQLGFAAANETIDAVYAQQPQQNLS